jgi:two-component sensor histidine kinase
MSAQAHGWSEPRRRGFQLDLLTALFAAIGAMVLVAIAALWVIAPRFFSFDPPEQVNLVLYAIAFVAILCAAEAYGRLVRCLRAAEERHQFLMEELTHRVRNLVAISHSIVRQALPGQSDVAEKINWRLAALVTTNDLLAKSAEGGADLRDLITKEFAPYDATRLALRGVSTVVPANLAIVFGLIFHELTTNAAKYGALSRPEGRIAIAWEIGGGKLNIDWVEIGGPPVVPPTRRGFGTKLLESSFRSLKAQVEADYQPTGFTCNISLPLSDQWAQSQRSRPVSSRSDIEERSCRHTLGERLSREMHQTRDRLKH